MYENIRNIMFKLEPESAHSLVEGFLRATNYTLPTLFSFFAKNCVYEDESLEQELFGLNFYNPLGLSAGFDKNASMIKPLIALGFGYLEYGSFTVKPQVGNERPRIFRLVEEESLQNNMGFNNEGKLKIANRLKALYPCTLPLIANIGKNKDSQDALADYLELILDFKDLCDIFTINISSPNTEGLRALQNEDFIKELLKKAKELTTKPILIKLAPDMDIKQALNLSFKAVEYGASGLILANTSTDYSLYQKELDFKSGGLSGKLIKEKNANFLKEIAKELYKDTVIIASGGIDDAKEGYERIKNGASLLQLFTAFIYKGPKISHDINKELAKLIKEDGFSNIKDAIGANLK